MELAYNKLKDSFNMLAKPDGSKKAPAKSCQTLKSAYPTKPSGDYWIDPNGMDSNDAIMVFCDMQTGASCIQPKPAMSHEIVIPSSEGQDAWVGEIESNAFDINYKADSNQLSFLQMMSSSAEQTVTFHCKDTAARPGTPSSPTSANTRRSPGLRQSSRCSQGSHQDCQLLMSRWKTLVAAAKLSSWKWAKFASSKPANCHRGMQLRL